MVTGRDGVPEGDTTIGNIQELSVRKPENPASIGSIGCAPVRKPDSSCRWVRQPGPGQIRGEGEWKHFEGDNAQWSIARAWFPTHVGDAPPETSPLSREARGR